MRSSREGNVVYLSSGWDSTSILAGLVHLHGKKKVRAVIGKMLYSERSGNCNKYEIERAKAVADYYGIKLDIVNFDYYQNGPVYLEEMGDFFKKNQLANITAMNWWLLAKGTKKSAPNSGEALFHGELSDAIHNLGFSQFATIFHPVYEFREYSDKMQSYLFGPTFLRTIQNGTFRNDPIYNLLKSNRTNTKFDEVATTPNEITKQLLKSFFLRPDRFPLYSLDNVNIISSEGKKQYDIEMSKYLLEASSVESVDNLYFWYLHLYNSFHWQSSTVASYALTALQENLKPYLPFSDSRMIEFCSAMPESWGRGLEIRPTKYPLKWMLQNKLDYPFHLQTGPHSYTYDTDHQFNHSAELLYASSFTNHFKEILRKKKYHHLLSAQTFNLEYLDRIVTSYLEGAELIGQERNDLFSLCWLETVGHY